MIDFERIESNFNHFRFEKVRNLLSIDSFSLFGLLIIIPEIKQNLSASIHKTF